MNNEPQIYGYMVLVMVSIAFFNFSGVSITKYMSATTRKVLDTLRTMVIWICQMLLHQVMRQCCNEYSDSDSNLFLRIPNIRIRIRDFCKTNNIRIRIRN